MEQRRWVGWRGVVALALSVTACGGGGGGGGGGSEPNVPTGIGLEDLNMDGRVTVLCFGDSITRGVGDGPSADSLPPAPAGYPARLQPELALKTTLPLVVIDSGNPGERTPDGVVRLRRNSRLNNPDYTILLEGTNDVEDGHTDEALENMQRMIDAVIADGGMPLLGTITPSCCNHKNQLPQEAVFFYNDQLRAIAAQQFDSVDRLLRGLYQRSGRALRFHAGVDPRAGRSASDPAGYDVMAATAQKIF